MTPVPGAVLDRLVTLNRSRHAKDMSVQTQALESCFDALFASGTRFAAYGSLAPGRQNHAVMAPAPGTWRNGLFANGDRIETGWGTDLGFPALRWRHDGPRVSIHLLTSSALPDFWQQLDAYEGESYVRILVPIFDHTGFVTVANLYEAAG